MHLYNYGEILLLKKKLTQIKQDKRYFMLYFHEKNNTLAILNPKIVCRYIRHISSSYTTELKVYSNN